MLRIPVELIGQAQPQHARDTVSARAAQQRLGQLSRVPELPSRPPQYLRTYRADAIEGLLVGEVSRDVPRSRSYRRRRTLLVATGRGQARGALERPRPRLGISTFVSLGNKADVSGKDLLAYWYDDPATRDVAPYLESFGNPRRFAWVPGRLV